MANYFCGELSLSIHAGRKDSSRIYCDLLFVFKNRDVVLIRNRPWNEQQAKR
jgi:hypothetical protein